MYCRPIPKDSVAFVEVLAYEATHYVDHTVKALDRQAVRRLRVERARRRVRGCMWVLCEENNGPMEPLSVGEREVVELVNIMRSMYPNAFEYLS